MAKMTEAIIVRASTTERAWRLIRRRWSIPEEYRGQEEKTLAFAATNLAVALRDVGRAIMAAAR